MSHTNSYGGDTGVCLRKTENSKEPPSFPVDKIERFVFIVRVCVRACAGHHEDQKRQLDPCSCVTSSCELPDIRGWEPNLSLQREWYPCASTKTSIQPCGWGLYSLGRARIQPVH